MFGLVLTGVRHHLRAARGGSTSAPTIYLDRADGYLRAKLLSKASEAMFDASASAVTMVSPAAASDSSAWRSSLVLSSRLGCYGRKECGIDRIFWRP